MSTGASEELDVLAERIARLVEKPEDVKSTFASLARPVMRALRWRPKLETDAVERLGQRVKLSEMEAVALRLPSIEECANAAREELAENVTSVERACVVHGRVPMAYASWLWRLHQVVRRVHGWLAAPDDAFGLRAMLAATKADTPRPLVATNARDDAVTPVAAIDPLLRAARDETELLGRRRRLLEAARTLLLDASASLELDADGTEARSNAIAAEIARIDRLEGAGLSPEVGIVHQLRQALARGETQRVHAGLVALEGFALERGDGTLGRLTGRALDELWGESSRFDGATREDSLRRSGGEVLAPRVLDAIERGLERAQARQREIPEWSTQERDFWRIQMVTGGREHLIAAALLADGCFEVGGTLSSVRVKDVRRTTRVVRHPTPDLVLAQAHGVDDLPDAVLDDPRTILLSLAAGKLLARRFVAEEVETIERSGLAGEARLYVLDGSTSMLGPRARMRDAILVAELSTLAARLADARRRVRPTLYYRYFTDKLDTLTVVEDEGQALLAIEQVLSTLRSGSTDIQTALLASFERIRIAREEDPELARAQIVLITDGDAPVDQEKVLAAREAVGSLPVGVSIIALGEENAALRALVARQRARGESAFYHFTSDRALAALVAEARSALPLHLPEARAHAAVSDVVRDVVDEIAARERGAQAEDIARARHEGPALEEIGLSIEQTLCDAELARVEALLRDDRTLQRRFERWFPAPHATANLPHVKPDPSDQEDLDLVVTLLASVAEVVELVGSEPLRRKADAIEIFERLLLDAGLAPWRYAELMKAHPEALAPSLEAVRTSAGLRVGAGAGTLT
ncbi:MAG TPA: vWA domain-containing protein [Polyangiaceae bacterium]